MAPLSLRTSASPGWGSVNASPQLGAKLPGGNLSSGLASLLPLGPSALPAAPALPPSELSSFSPKAGKGLLPPDLDLAPGIES